MLPLGISEDVSERKKVMESPLPWRQLGRLHFYPFIKVAESRLSHTGILLLLNLAEPITATIIYPFIAEVVPLS
jgi:hypothetical protein